MKENFFLKLIVRTFLTFSALVFLLTFSLNVAFAADGDVTFMRMVDFDGDKFIDRIAVDIENATFDTWVVDGTPSLTVSMNGSNVNLTGITMQSASSNPATFVVDLDTTDPSFVQTTNGVTADAIELVYNSVIGDNTCTNCIKDVTDNELLAVASGDTGMTDTEYDYTAPFISGLIYKDANNDGYIDTVSLQFSELLSSTSVLSANDFTFTNVGDFTGMAFGNDSTDLLTVDTSTLDITLGTASSVLDTFDDSGSIAFSSQNAFSLIDASANSNPNSSLSGQTSATIVDGAAPVYMGAQTLDTDSNGTVESIGLQYSENISDASVIASDFEAGIADTTAGNLIESILASAANDAIIIVGVSNSSESIVAMKTNYELWVEQVSSVDDLNGNTLASFASSQSADAALPVVKEITFNDSNLNGGVDRLTFLFSENVQTSSDAGTVISDFGTITLPNGDTVTSGAADSPVVCAGGSNNYNINNVKIAGNVETANYTDIGSFGIAGLTTQWKDCAISPNTASSMIVAGTTYTDDAAPVPTLANVDAVKDTESFLSASVANPGDIIKFTWDASVATGDSAEDVASVDADFSEFGGGLVAMVDDGSSCDSVSGDFIWSACYTIEDSSVAPAGAVDSAVAGALLKNILDASSNLGVNFDDDSNISVDNEIPNPTVANISVDDTGCTGTSGECIIGDTVVATWNVSGAGDNISDLASAQADFIEFGASIGAYVSFADQGAGIWTASYVVEDSLVSGTADDNTNVVVLVKGVDDAGNISVGNPAGFVADDTQYSMDNIMPIVTVETLDISTDNGIGGIASVNGNGTAPDEINLNITLSVADGDTIVWDASPAGGSATAANNTPEVLVAGNTDNATQTFDYTVTDNAGNVLNDTTTPTLDVDNKMPAVSTPGSFTFDTDTNSDVIANIGDKVDYVEGTVNTPDTDTWEVDITGLNGNASAVAAGNPHTVNEGVLNGSTQFTEWITDNAGNSVSGNTVAMNVDNRSVLDNTSVVLSNTEVNKTTSFTLSFDTRQAWGNDGLMEITFPAQFNVSGLNGKTATSLSNIDGVITAAVVGQVVTLTRDGSGSLVSPFTSVSFVLSSGTNGATAGATGTFAFKTQDSVATDIDSDSAVAGVTLTAASGGGGGGGGGTSQTPSITPTNISSPINTDKIYARPVALDASLFTTDPTNGTIVAQLTKLGGSLTIKSLDANPITMFVPEDTKVAGAQNWNGVITIPTVKTVSNLISDQEFTIEGAAGLFSRYGVSAIVEFGSNTTPLYFSNPITIQIPTDLADGTSVLIFSSEDGGTWTREIIATVQNGMIVFTTDHLSYYGVYALDDTMLALLSQDTAITDTLSQEATNVDFNVLPFNDIDGHWAKDYIVSLYDMGVVNGKTAEIFGPDDYITRAELTKIALNTFGYDVASSVAVSDFSDVDVSLWYAPFVKAAKMAGIVMGYEDDTFKPNNQINRAEALKILIEASKFDKGSTFDMAFDDVSESDWFYEYVGYAYNAGIVSGYDANNFAPGASITRAEVSKIAIKLYELK